MAALANSREEFADGGGTRLGEVDRTSRGGGGEYRGGKQPSLQQEEEGGKEKERAKASVRDDETKIRQ